MKIFLICDVTLNDIEAQNIHVIELFNNIGKVADAYLFVPRPEKIKFVSPNIRYIPILLIPMLGMISYQLSLIWHLFLNCRRMKVDAIYARQSDFTFVPLIVSYYFRIPYFVEVNGLITEEMKLMRTSKLRISIAKVSEKLGYQHAKKIVAVTPGVKKAIKQLYDIPEEKIAVIENGANIDLFRPVSKEEARKQLNLLQDEMYISFVGNFAPWQGIEYLIHAAQGVLSVFPQACFLMVGDGIMKEEWMALAEKLGVSRRFFFTGCVPYQDVHLYISASDVCVAPFRKGRNEKIGLSPLKLYEYLACERPVVCSRIPNIEFLEQQNTGILVESENPEELAKAIIRLFCNKQLREEMGKNGRRYVMQNHSWEAIGKKVEEMIETDAAG